MKTECSLEIRDESFVDRCASEHRVGYPEFLTDVQKLNDTSAELLNGRKVTLRNQEKFIVEVSHEQTIFSSVHYIHVMNVNILSYPSMYQHGVTITRSNRRCVLTDRKDNVSFTNIVKKDRDGLFVTKIVSSSAKIGVNTTVAIGQEINISQKATQTVFAMGLCHVWLRHVSREWLIRWWARKSTKCWTKMPQNRRTASYVTWHKKRRRSAR